MRWLGVADRMWGLYVLVCVVGWTPGLLLSRGWYLCGVVGIIMGGWVGSDVDLARVWLTSLFVFIRGMALSLPVDDSSLLASLGVEITEKVTDAWCPVLTLFTGDSCPSTVIRFGVMCEEVAGPLSDCLTALGS